jgi:hypothetical protein
MKAMPQDNGGRRFRLERREFSYTFYSPERRSDKDRRNETDRRKKQKNLTLVQLFQLSKSRGRVR